ncbi:pre T-cell antigen receptor alpha [Phaethornis superciliosus]
MEVPCVLIAAALLPLLRSGRADEPLPTLAPPLSMVVAGQRRQLVVCVVSDLAPSSGNAVWISSQNGSALQSFAYGSSQEDGGSVCTVSLLPDHPPAEGDLACHVGPNRTSPAHSSSLLHITGTAPPLPILPNAGQPSGEQVRGPTGNGCTPRQRVQEGVCGWSCCTPGAGSLPPSQLHPYPTGKEEMAVQCSSGIDVPLARALAALLVGLRVVLLKVALCDALLTSLLLAQR